MTHEKRETAIKWLQNEIRSLRLAPTINGCGPENWADLLEIMETCLEAVKGCFVDTNKMSPLTLNQLREMDGQPVWVDSLKQWGIVDMLDKVVALPGYGVIDLAAIGNKGAYAYFLPINTLLARAEAAEDRAEKAEKCIYAIEDDLDRGNDKDWAREHIAEWKGQKEERA
jgi:hypothetical protein